VVVAQSGSKGGYFQFAWTPGTISCGLSIGLDLGEHQVRPKRTRRPVADREVGVGGHRFMCRHLRRRFTRAAAALREHHSVRSWRAKSGPIWRKRPNAGDCDQHLLGCSVSRGSPMRSWDFMLSRRS